MYAISHAPCGSLKCVPVLDALGFHLGARACSVLGVRRRGALAPPASIPRYRIFSHSRGGGNGVPKKKPRYVSVSGRFQNSNDYLRFTYGFCSQLPRPASTPCSPDPINPSLSRRVLAYPIRSPAAPRRSSPTPASTTVAPPQDWGASFR